MPGAVNPPEPAAVRLPSVAAAELPAVQTPEAVIPSAPSVITPLPAEGLGWCKSQSNDGYAKTGQGLAETCEISDGLMSRESAVK